MFIRATHFCTSKCFFLPFHIILLATYQIYRNHTQSSVWFCLTEVTSGLSTAGSSCQRELLVLNFDMDSECVDGELRATLQWIAASELGVPALYFRRTQEHNLAKVRTNGGCAFVRITNQVRAESAPTELRRLQHLSFRKLSRLSTFK